jgi:hypothetical protein
LHCIVSVSDEWIVVIDTNELQKQLFDNPTTLFNPCQWILPRRILIKYKSPLTICDYLMPDENEEVRKRIVAFVFVVLSRSHSLPLSPSNFFFQSTLKDCIERINALLSVEAINASNDSLIDIERFPGCD